jgi:hypothetical protein
MEASQKFFVSELKRRLNIFWWTIDLLALLSPLLDIVVWLFVTGLICLPFILASIDEPDFVESFTDLPTHKRIAVAIAFFLLLPYSVQWFIWDGIAWANGLSVFKRKKHMLIGNSDYKLTLKSIYNHPSKAAFCIIIRTRLLSAPNSFEVLGSRVENWFGYGRNGILAQVPTVEFIKLNKSALLKRLQTSSFQISEVTTLKSLCQFIHDAHQEHLTPKEAEKKLEKVKVSYAAKLQKSVLVTE